MKSDIAERIAEAGADNGLEIRLMSDYSGRGMFGQATSALVVPDVATFAAAVGLAASQKALEGQNVHDLIEAVKEVRTDSLGHDMIVY
jgi:hypothetical protein